jgi:hypothetical protein
VTGHDGDVVDSVPANYNPSPADRPDGPQVLPLMDVPEPKAALPPPTAGLVSGLWYGAVAGGEDLVKPVPIISGNGAADDGAGPTGPAEPVGPPLEPHEELLRRLVCIRSFPVIVTSTLPVFVHACLPAELFLERHKKLRVDRASIGCSIGSF